MEKVFEASLFDELESVFPDTCACEGVNTYTVSAADGTYAAVQVVLSGLEPGQFITVEADGSHNCYKWFQLLTLPVEVNSGAQTRTEWTMQDTNPNVIRRAPFSIYDVQKPFSNIITVNSTSAALVFRYKVCAPEYGCANWKLRVRQRNIIKELNFIVEEFPVTVNEAVKEDHMYVNWISAESIANAHNAPLFSDKWYTVYEEYLRLAKYGRQNMVLLPTELYFEFDENNKPVLIEKKLDKLISILDKLGFYWIEGGHLAGRKDNEWDATQGICSLTGGVFPGDGLKDIAGISAQIYSYIKKHKLEKRWIQSVMDEPIDCLANAFTAVINTVKENMPKIKILDATIARETIAGTVDYWCPTIDKFEKYQDFFEERKKLGDEIFVYTCLNPAGNFCNRLLDMERLRAVWIGWAPAKYESISGFLHWGGIYLNNIDPFYLTMPIHNVTEYKPYKDPTVLPAGDNAIMYPDTFSPMPSARLEAQRIGFEDLVLLEKLKKQDSEKARQIIDKVFRRYDEYSKCIAQYRSVKKELLEALNTI